MYLPNYRDGSIVNLMSSVIRACGGKSHHSPLRVLSPAELGGSKNIVVIVVDGLGYEYLNKYGKGGVFERYLRAKITSVFPATTASAITTFHTGLEPGEHAITGWYMNLKEIGIVSTFLKAIPRVGGATFGRIGVDIRELFGARSLMGTIKRSSFVVIPKEIQGSDFSNAIYGRRGVIGYQSLKGMCRAIRKCMKKNNSKKLIYAYWPYFDSCCHEKGVDSREAYVHFHQLELELGRFLCSIKSEDTTVIITADHGLIDTIGSRVIWIEDHPRLKEALTLPLCGEARVAYCYVHPSRARGFEQYVRKRLGHACQIFKSESLIKKKYFGLARASGCLFDRIGDYVVVMKENYIIRDVLAGKRFEFNKGNHGGVSREEMFVPLIVFK